MKFRKYHIVLTDDGGAEVYGVTWVGTKRYLGTIQREQIHQLFL